jgi:hypothetical protein
MRPRYPTLGEAPGFVSVRLAENPGCDRIPRMKKLSSPPNRRRSGIGGVVIGRERFAKISAIEGIELSPAAKKRAAEFDRLVA